MFIEERAFIEYLTPWCDTHCRKSSTFRLLTVILTVNWGRDRIQKTVIRSPTRSKNRCPRSVGCSHVVLRRVGLKLSICGCVSDSRALCLPCHEDIIDTVSCSNRCMVTCAHTESSYTVWSLIGLSLADDESHRQLEGHSINILLTVSRFRRSNCQLSAVEHFRSQQHGSGTGFLTMSRRPIRCRLFSRNSITLCSSSHSQTLSCDIS